MGDLVSLFVLLFVHGTYVSAQTSAVCGELHTSYSYSGTTINYDIRLIRSNSMSPYITNNMYRWYLSRVGHRIVVIINKETNCTINYQKYSESNFTLHIYGFTREDEGTYVVECRRNINDQYIGRDRVYISLPENKPSETTTVQLIKSTYSDEGNTNYGTKETTTPQLRNSTYLDTTNNRTNDVSVIVVALCVVVVVVVVAMTVIWIKRHQRVNNENKKQVNNDEISVRYIPGEAVDESVYNEIDIDRSSVTSEAHYAEIHAQHDAHLHQSQLSSDISPRLPVIPNGGACNDNYANICRAENIQGNPNERMSNVWSQLQNTTTTVDVEISDDREYIILEPNNAVAPD